MGSRRKAREFALQMLYQMDLRGVSPSEVMGTFWTGITSQADERAFSEQMVNGIDRRLNEIDDLIEAQSINWKIARMPLVDRNILRMGVYELLHMRDVPATVTMNEAIELGKRYSTQESGAFINGILDKVARTLPAGSKIENTATGFSGDGGDYLEDDED